MSIYFKRISTFLIATLVILIVPSLPAKASVTPCPTSICVLDNGILRFGNGGTNSTTYTPSENSVNPDTGLFNQPFYKSADGKWYKLTYSSYPLDMAVGSGTGGANWTGNTVVDFSDYNPTITEVDYSGFVVTSSSGSSWSKGYGVITVKLTHVINGKNIEVTQRYELGRTAQFVKITTRVKNTDASSINNLNIWVGTRDDYVGRTDSPVKTRGNLNGAGGTFQRLTSAADKASALQITTASEGALFYSTTPNTDMSFNSCCSFSNAYNQLPATSTSGGADPYAGIQSVADDGSYAAVLRAGTLAPAATAEIIWFYAAGSLADLDSVASAVAAAAAPEVPTAQRNNNSVVLNWVAPTTTDPITNYAIRYTSDGGATWTTITRSPPSTSLTETITGLSNTLAYEFQVAAITTAGSPPVNTQGDWSGGSLANILGSPNAPTSGTATGGDRSAVITFTNATTNGTETATVTNYEYYLGSPDTWTALSPVDTSSPITLTGLTNGSNYTVQIRAVNRYGAGPSLTIENVRTLPVFTDAILNTAIETNTAYSDGVSATSGVTYSYTGTLPTGLSFNTSTGALTGTTGREDGSFTFTITATNSAGSVSRTYTLATSGAGATGQPPVVLPSSPSFTSVPSFTAAQNQPFSASIAASGSESYEVVGSLPDGLTLNRSTGQISGTPTVFGNFNMTIIATNAGGRTSATFPINISRYIRPMPSLDAITLPESNIGSPFVTLNGSQISAVVQPNSNVNGIEVIASGWRLAISASGEDGQAAPLNAQQQLLIQDSQRVYVGGSGFKPNSEVRIFLFSTVISLGTTTTDSKGEFAGLYEIKGELAEGKHTVQVNGVSPENDLRSASIPAIFAKTKSTKPATPTGNGGSGAIKTIVIPFAFNKYSIDKKQIEILKSIDAKSLSEVKIYGYAQPSSTQAAIALSLNRAIEVKKSVSQILSVKKYTTLGLGVNNNSLCAPYKNKCVVVYVYN